MDRDFDIGNIIYLIATIVAVIVGILGKKKKPASGKSVADAVFEEYEESNAEGMPPETLVQEAVARAETKSDLMVEYEKLLAEKGISADYDFFAQGDTTTEVLEVISLEEEEEGYNFLEAIEEFDATRAIVYSTIINRIDY